MPRVGLALAIGCVFFAFSLTGCSDAFNAGPLEYVENEALTTGCQRQSQPGEEPVLSGEGSQGPEEPLRRFAPAHQGAGGLGPAAGGAVSGEPRAGGRRGAGQVLRGCMKTRRSTRRRGSGRGLSRRQAAGRGLCPLSPQLPALSWRIRCGRRADGAVPLSHAARLSQGNFQVHVDAQRQAAAPRLICGARSQTACTARRCRRFTPC